MEDRITAGLYLEMTDRSPDDVTGYHFRRYPRPGQGRLTGKPTVGLLLVLVSPRSPEAAQALRDWADFVHLRHIAEVAVPGYTMITPYEHAVGGDPRFLHCYVNTFRRLGERLPA